MFFFKMILKKFGITNTDANTHNHSNDNNSSYYSSYRRSPARTGVNAKVVAVTSAIVYLILIGVQNIKIPVLRTVMLNVEVVL